jgi:stage II sporulation protein P
MRRKWRRIRRNWQGKIPWRPFWLLFFLSFLLTFTVRYFSEGAVRRPKAQVAYQGDWALWLLNWQLESPKTLVSSQLGFLEGGRNLPSREAKAKPRPKPEAKAPTVAIYHTHTGESYVPSSGKEREVGREGDIVQVGAALAQGLEAHGIGVLHVRKVHDQEPWRLAYTRSRATVRQLKEQYPSLQLFIDLHRDGIRNPKTAKDVTTTTVGEQSVARVMLYVGSERGGKSFPNREKVMAFNDKLQRIMEQLYPGLARPIFTKGLFPHNQDLADNFLLVEIGDARLNNKEEALRGAGLLADSLALLLFQEGRNENSP